MCLNKFLDDVDSAGSRTTEEPLLHIQTISFCIPFLRSMPLFFFSCDAPHLLSLPTLSSELYLLKLYLFFKAKFLLISLRSLCFPHVETVGQQVGCLLRVQTLSATYELVFRKNAHNKDVSAAALSLESTLFLCFILIEFKTP